jgi:hypothetical protein
MSLVVLALLALSASGVTRGLCFMPGTGEAGPRDAHACCKKGWTTAAPDCCMAGAADEEPARTALLATPGAPASVRIAIVPATPGLLFGKTLAPGDCSHSPPGRVPLRI